MTYESDNPQFDHLINSMDSDEVPYPRSEKREDETITGFTLRRVVEEARWKARREVAALLRGDYDCPAESCEHPHEWACAADLIDVQDDLVPGTYRTDTT